MYRKNLLTKMHVMYSLVLAVNSGMNAGETTSVLDSDSYKKFCLESPSMPAFRKHFWILDSIDNQNVEQGEIFIDFIEKNFPKLVEAKEEFSTSELVGEPKTYYFKNWGYFSPSTLRYIKVLGDLQLHFGSLDNFKILEIGGGYGGQCKIIFDCFSPNSYTIVDLKEAKHLLNSYLPHYGLDETSGVYFKSSKGSKPLESDLLIANYSFSECSKSMQQEYFKSYILRSKNGYITYNTWENIGFDTFSVEEIVSVLMQNGYQVQVLPEEPQTSKQNCIIVYKRK